MFNTRRAIFYLLASVCFAVAVKAYIFIFQPADPKIIENAALVLLVVLPFLIFSPSGPTFDFAERWFSQYLRPGDHILFQYPADSYSALVDPTDMKTEGRVVSIMKGSVASIMIDDTMIELPVRCITKILSGGC